MTTRPTLLAVARSSTSKCTESAIDWNEDGERSEQVVSRARFVLSDGWSRVRCRVAECRHACDQHCYIAVGPRAHPPEPAMPPEFLPVPVSPALAPVNPATPVPARGAVERDFGPQLTVAGRD